jgi:hypothetical protein
MTRKVTLYAGGINSSWYIVAEIDDVKLEATILVHDRLHNERDAGLHPKTDGSGRIIESEDNKRNAVALTITRDGLERTYNIVNPKHVFAYGRLRSAYNIKEEREKIERDKKIAFINTFLDLDDGNPDTYYALISMSQKELEGLRDVVLKRNDTITPKNNETD